MRRWLGFLVTLVLGSVLSAALSGRLTVLRVLGQAIMFGGLFGPMYLAPRRYAEWPRRCRLPGFLRRA